ncbi:hypothetical protein ACJJTC_007956 [Scirpophaga incertulas]
MTLTLNNADENIGTKIGLFESSNWDSLYCTHLWSNSHLRKSIISPPSDSKIIRYCYTCKGKIRKYEIKSSSNDFAPSRHSTPNGKIEGIEDNLLGDCSLKILTPDISPSQATNNDIESYQCIPTISHQIDSRFRQKLTSFEMRPNEINPRRLRKSLKGIGCIVNLALNDSSVKKRKQIQACSISVMIIAIIVISFVLVNFTSPYFTRMTNPKSTTLVPTIKIESNISSSAIVNLYTNPTPAEHTTARKYFRTESQLQSTTEHASLLTNVILKIRKNVRTFPKFPKKERLLPKDIINRDLSNRFCSCQRDEICMLDENSGKSICRKAVDVDDPTGCGGLCALETEACQLVDKYRGVRVCRLLTLVTCSPQEWRCRNGLCVKAEQRCDGIIQCYDRSDEIHCDCDLKRQFRCSHSISCFSNTKLCDGVIDCWDGFDELNCTAMCPGNQFTCTNGQCIVSSRFCDNLVDCADGSDEPHGCLAGCSAHEVRCSNSRCVPMTARCDGKDQCGDASDELHCSTSN